MGKSNNRLHEIGRCDVSVYFPEDIEGVITGNVLSVVLASRAQGVTNVEYVRGSLAMAQAVAASFGLAWPVMLEGLRHQVSIEGWCELLDTATGTAYLVGSQDK